MVNMKKKIKLIVFASGSGTTFEYLAERSEFTVIGLITDKKQCGAKERAQKREIPVYTIRPQDYSSFKEWDQALTQTIKKMSSESRFHLEKSFTEELPSEKTTSQQQASNNPSEKVLQKSPTFHWIILTGFLRRLGPCFLSEFKNKVINSHPSLLPKFGGKGMYGRYVHQAVCKAGEKQTGITVHYVNEEYDQGDIVDQKTLPVFPHDSPESLEERVKQAEKLFYAETIKKLTHLDS